MKRLFLLHLYTLCLIPYTFSQWNANPAINTPVCMQSYDQQDVRIVTDSKGGAIMTWQDFRNDAAQLSGDIFAQRIDKNGVIKWTANGVVLCADISSQVAPSIVEDGFGGAIIVWNDSRNGNKDIYAQRIDSLGVVQWTANGISVAAKANHQQDAKLISNGVGGAILVWQDSSNGAWDIYAQQISNNGNILWGAAGIPICTAADAQINARIETDGAFGAIVVWQDKRNGLDHDIYVQRINTAGLVQWAVNGVPVCTSISTQSNPKIEPDGSGGVIIAWQDKRNGIDYNVYAQRLNSAGVVQWIANGVTICSAAASQSAIDMTSEGVNGAIITWKDQRSGNYDIYAQKIDLAGLIQWTAGGIGIATTAGAQLNPNVVGDASGGAIVTWQDSSLGSSDIKTQRVDASGVVQWTAGGVLVGSAADNQTSPKNVSDGSGGCIYTFQDKRNGTNFDIYAHHLYANGAVDGIYEHHYLMESKCFPNPFRESAEIQLPVMIRGAFSIRLFDIFGQQVRVGAERSVNGFIIQRNDLSNGIYFYEIKTSENIISTGKVTIID